MTALTSRPLASRRFGKRIGSASLGIIAWIVALLVFLPVGWMFMTGFKQERDAYVTPPTIFFQPTLDQYVNLFEGNIGRSLMNSVVASGVSLLIVLVLALAAAYALAINPIPKWRDGMFFFLSTRFLPPVAAVVPLYLIARDLSLLDNILILIIMYTAMNLPLAIWMLQSFLSEIPKEIFEAASMDGAGFFTTMRRIVLPLATPGIAATSLICIIFSWNEFFFAVNFTSVKATTMPVFLLSFAANEGLFWAQLSAAATIATLPIILLGWIAQDKLVQGLTMGAVK
ncbi:carbohydrate ABC transporter permease [soil metagenome]